MHDEEWTPAEREAFANLPRTADGGELLEERTVRALADRGLLEPRSPRRISSPMTRLAAVAACAVFFVAGFALGRSREDRPTQEFAGSVLDSVPAQVDHAVGSEPAWEVATVDTSQSTDTRSVMWF
jgi:hypothetical protein